MFTYAALSNSWSCPQCVMENDAWNNIVQPFGEKNAISAAVTRDGRILEMLRRGNLVLCLYLFLLRKYLSILYERKGDNSVPVLFTAPTSQSNTWKLNPVLLNKMNVSTGGGIRAACDKFSPYCGFFIIFFYLLKMLFLQYILRIYRHTHKFVAMLKRPQRLWDLSPQAPHDSFRHNKMSPKRIVLTFTNYSSVASATTNTHQSLL